MRFVYVTQGVRKKKTNSALTSFEDMIYMFVYTYEKTTNYITRAFILAIGDRYDL